MAEKYLLEICNPKQWKTIPKSQLLENGKFPVYGANGIIGRYNEYNHEKPTVLITCRGATCGNIHITVPKAYINGNAMALDNLNEIGNIPDAFFNPLYEKLKMYYVTGGMPEAVYMWTQERDMELVRKTLNNTIVVKEIEKYNKGE